jgi:pyruvate dehydrogenase E1 component alpha subunit
MQPEDVYVPYYRDMPTLYVRGVPMEQNLQYWGGDERGSVFYKADGELSEDLPICVPIATQITHAAGIAAAFKLRNQPRVAVVTIGDGGTSKETSRGAQLCRCLASPHGDDHQQQPVGHLGAAQVAVERAHPGPEGHRGRGAAQVDGNDVVAVYEATRAAVERARSGKGPTLIEAVSYRLGDHTTADDATRYRDGAEVEAAWAREPVKRLRQFMFERGWWDEQQEQALLAEAGREVERAVAAYERPSAQAPETLLDYQFAELPKAYLAQRQRIIAKGMQQSGEGL